MVRIPEELLPRLTSAIEAYDAHPGPVYDEIFHEVNDRIRRSGDAGKMDIAAITVWKRSTQGRWMKGMLRTPEADVRAATRAAFAKAKESDLDALRALAVLPGYEGMGPLATALLCAADPEHFGVMDRRAHKALDLFGLGVGRRRGMTLRYLERVRELRDELRPSRPGTTARDVDKGLFMLGAPS